MKAADLTLLSSVSRPSVSPDGSRVVVSVSHPHLGADTTVGQLWIVRTDGTGAGRITRGVNDSAPEFSPDGRAIAFLRSSPGNPPQLYMMDAAGGEPLKLTDRKLGVTEFRWSDDSTRIAFVSRVPEQGRYGTVEEIKSDAEPARLVTGLRYKSNGLGYTNDRRAQLFLLTTPPLTVEPSYESFPLPDGTKPPGSLVPEPLQLTTGDFDVSSPRFLGDRIAFISARHENRDRDLRSQIWATTVNGAGEPHAVTPTDWNLYIESFETENGIVRFLAQEIGTSGTDFVGRNSALYRVDGSDTVRLTDPEVVDFAGVTMSVSDGVVYVADRARGRQHLMEIREDATSTLTTGDVIVHGQAVVGDSIVVTYSSPTTFGDVAIVRDGELTPLTDLSAELRSTGLVEPVELTVSGRDGYEIHGWVATPTGEGPHPTILLIHGGPFADYTVQVFDEVQVLADAGYAVVFCNPRGSAGYGREHGTSIKEAMGTVDLHDVLDFLDRALDANPDLDRARLGIVGGSYGGYLAAWAIGNDHRFKAAIVERGYLDPEAFIGSSDIGWFFPREYNGSDRDGVRAQSPQAVADQVTTPTLVIHSENDLRCPIAQAETYYSTLALNGVETEMLIFPGEDHDLSRSGRPRHRLQRFEAILTWLGRYV